MTMSHEDRLKRLMDLKQVEGDKKGSVVNDKLKAQLREQSFEEQLETLSPEKKDAPEKEQPKDGPPRKLTPVPRTGPKNISKGTAPKDEKPEERLDRLMGYLDYDDLDEKLNDPENTKFGMKVDNELRFLANGGLFMEAVNLKAEKDYYQNKAPENVETSNEEKLHVPTTADDVGQRWAIVSKLCLARGIVNWKVAKQDLLDNKVSGTDATFDLLSKAGLLDKSAKPGMPASAYVKQAIAPERRKVLRGFLDNPKNFDKLDKGELAQQVVMRCENVVLDQGAFPEEQSGREITIYIKPKLLDTTKEWSAFVSDLYEAFESSGLPMLPIAVGDKAVAGGGVKKNGKTLGYFSYRNEANAKDKQLGYTGFPHWMGGNADKSNAAKQKMQLDKAKVTKPKKGKSGTKSKSL